MKITTDHPTSSYGIPVILDDAGEPMDYVPGIAVVRRQLGLSVADVAAAVGVSPRTVENWEQGRRMPPPNVLYVLSTMLATARPI